MPVNALRMNACTDVIWEGGGIANTGIILNSGYVGITYDSFGISDVASGMVRLSKLLSLDLEACSEYLILLSGLNDVEISCYIRNYTNHHASYPSISLGIGGTAQTVANAIIRSCYAVSDSGPGGGDVFLQAGNVDGLLITNNFLTGFSQGFVIDVSVENYVLKPTNVFENTTASANFVQYAGATRSYFDSVADEPVVISNGATISVDFSSSLNYYLELNSSSHTFLSPTGGAQVPAEYTVIVTQTSGVGSITTWGVKYLWKNSVPPNFAMMGTGTYLKIKMKAVNLGSSSGDYVLLCDWWICG